MTNLAIDDLPIEEVVPGSANDPFSQNYKPSEPVVASPAATADGATSSSVADGSQVQTQPTATAPVAAPSSTAAPNSTPATPAPATPAAALSPLEQAIKDGKLDEYVAGLVQEGTAPIVRQMQSNYDKKIAALEADAKAARDAAKKIERENALADLDDDERQRALDKFALEDERANLDEYRTELEAYWKTIYVAANVQEFGKFGVTAEELEACDTQEAMDEIVREKELNYYRSGMAQSTPTQQVPTSQVTATTETVPAGVSAPSDIGGGAPSAPTAQFDETVGLDTMAKNLNNLPWETLKFN